MTIRFYNTYSKTIEGFKPIRENEVRMYNCGPTVYDHPHIGNFRAFIFADILRRYLEFRGFKVIQVMNITDVGHLTMDDIEAGEDKMMAAAKREKKDPWQIAEYYTQEFFALSKELNLKPVYKNPRATEHIQQMIEMIEILLKKGYAYKTADGVYFDISKFPNYGKLSGNPLDKLMAGARVEINPNKRHPLDFALWKYDPKHIMQWDAPFGRGFPGWHIECSVMSSTYLGQPFDIHTGGEDNIFPHHESEIAQSESAYDKKFCNYWLHVRHLLVDGEKMSKSTGNFYTVRDIFHRGYSPIVLRYTLLCGHYRSPLNFTFSSLDAAKGAVLRILSLHSRLSEILAKATPLRKSDYAKSFRERFISVMDEDLNISEGLAVVFDFIHKTNVALNRELLVPEDVKDAFEFMSEFDSVLGIVEMYKPEIEQESIELIQKREELRKIGNFEEADRIRKLLLERGILIEDTREGPRWYKF